MGKFLGTLTGVVVLCACLCGQTVSTFIPSNVGDAIALGNDGFIYSVHDGGNEIRKIHPNTGEITTVLTVTNTTYSDIALDSDMDIYVSSFDEGTIEVLRSGTSSLSDLADGINQPYGLVVANDGNLLVPAHNPSRILRVFQNGTDEVAGTGIPLFWPTHPIIAPDGNLYCGSVFRGDVFKVTPQGVVTIVAEVPEVTGAPNVVDVAWANGKLYACHYSRHSIYEIDVESGEATLFAGVGLAGVVNGPALSARFEFPTSIVASASGDKLFVTEGPAKRMRLITLTTSVSPDLRINGLLATVSPNPAGLSAHVLLEIDNSLELELRLTDPNGRVVQEVVKRSYPAGEQQLEFSLEHLPAGLYLVEILAKDGREVLKLVKE